MAAGGATAALASSGVCSGTYELDCEYCSYESGATGQPAYRCENGWRGYTWQQRGIWVSGSCLVGVAPA